MSRDADILIVGAGASGLAAAIEAERVLPGVSVTLLERSDRSGRKILATGNGRCNLSNRNISAEGYNPAAGKFSPVFQRYGDDEAFFRSMGLVTYADAEGRVYPLSGQAASVLDALRFTAASSGARTVCGVEITGIDKGDVGLTVTAADGRTFSAGKVIIAAGSPAGVHGFGNTELITSLERCGESFRSFSPALVQITVKDLPAQFRGTRARAVVMLTLEDGRSYAERGEVQFGEGYVSGICVMDLSRHYDGREKACLSIDFCPGMSGEEISRVLETARSARASADAPSVLSGLVPKAVGETVLRRCCRDVYKRKTGSLTPEEIADITGLIKGFGLETAGKGAFGSAQICTGGFTDLNCETLESEHVRGLYFCGEMVDVDGRCGGFNLHWAWASGRAAGAAAASSL